MSNAGEMAATHAAKKETVLPGAAVVVLESKEEQAVQRPRTVIEQADEAGVHIRPLVRKLYPKFLGYLRAHGSDVVKGVLQNGKCGKYRLTIMKNKKDRYQMMQLLDMV